MKYGIFSDIHSNLEALQAVLEDMHAQSVGRVVCLGDITGYNANPRECLETVRGLRCVIVRGNHDHETCHDGKINHFNSMAVEGIMHSRRQLSETQKTFLKNLPLQAPVDAFTVVHASLNEPEAWNYVLHPEDAARHFLHQKTQLCFFGHTHVPHLFAEGNGEVAEFIYNKIDLSPAKRYFVNVGSVGQPRDGDWRAAYAIYDSTNQSLELRRLRYDIAKAQEKIHKAGLPGRLADRLERAK